MGDVQVGTASWTDPTLIEVGWYPVEATAPDQRLRYDRQMRPVQAVPL
jgi:hypothetical protein